jgi:hypothetical protein
LNVIPFKQPPVKGLQPPARKAPTEPRYYCLGCNGMEFLLLEDGRVFCATEGCHSFIRNLEVRG